MNYSHVSVERNMFQLRLQEFGYNYQLKMAETLIKSPQVDNISLYFSKKEDVDIPENLQGFKMFVNQYNDLSDPTGFGIINVHFFMNCPECLDSFFKGSQKKVFIKGKLKLEDIL